MVRISPSSKGTNQARLFGAKRYKMKADTMPISVCGQYSRNTSQKGSARSSRVCVPQPVLRPSRMLNRNQLCTSITTGANSVAKTLSSTTERRIFATPPCAFTASGCARSTIKASNFGA